MKRNKIIIIVLAALSLLNLIVGGLMGFISIKGDDQKTLNIIFWLCMPMAIFCLLVSLYSLRKADVDTTYNTLRLRKWHFVKEQRHYKTDNKLQALELAISAWLLSLGVLLFSFGTIWPDTFWQSSFNVLIMFLGKFLGAALVLMGLIFGIIKYKRGKGASV